jgi:hypothetical protein
VKGKYTWLNSPETGGRHKRMTSFEEWRKRTPAPEVIAAKLNRSVRAIKTRAYRIGLPLKWSKLKAKGK